MPASKGEAALECAEAVDEEAVRLGQVPPPDAVVDHFSSARQHALAVLLVVDERARVDRLSVVRRERALRKEARHPRALVLAAVLELHHALALALAVHKVSCVDPFSRQPQHALPMGLVVEPISLVHASGDVLHPPFSSPPALHPAPLVQAAADHGHRALAVAAAAGPLAVVHAAVGEGVFSNAVGRLDGFVAECSVDDLLQLLRPGGDQLLGGREAAQHHVWPEDLEALLLLRLRFAVEPGEDYGPMEEGCVLDVLGLLDDGDDVVEDDHAQLLAVLLLFVHLLYLCLCGKEGTKGIDDA
mmetsp:Transcript_10175/g.41405  ORF Transcript_10175/g.41405 Transcript_10175/m.41405 type:complete len:301 (-) Transcript_10175:864-1766(-)